MNRPFVIACLMCLLNLPAPVLAQVPSNQSTGPNIVTLNFNAAVLQTAEARHAFETLQTQLTPRKNHLQALNEEIEGMRKQLNTSNDKLNDTEKHSREQALTTKERQLEREAEDFRNDSQNESQQIFQKVAQKLYGFLQSYSQQHGYSFVIERGSETAPVIWYAANNMDITNQLIKDFDEKNRASGTKP